jgi:Tol biopolymer transport system component
VRPVSSHTARPQLKYQFLTSAPGSIDLWPCFSPDGKTVVFSRSTDKGKTWDLFIVPSSGGLAKRLSTTALPVSANRPNWSAKTNLIAFTGESSDDKTSVWLINPDGTQARRVFSSGLSDQVFYPHWYPDGKRLAVVDFGDGNGGVLKQIDIKRGVATALTNPQQILAGKPSVSHDGRWIAFAGQKNEGQVYDQTRNSIWLISEIGKLQRLEPNQGRAPEWSPDGQRIAFESDRGSPNHLYAIFVINQKGSALKQMTPYELDGQHPVWSPASKFLVFSARHSENPDERGIAIIEVPKL